MKVWPLQWLRTLSVAASSNTVPGAPSFLLAIHPEKQQQLARAVCAPGCSPTQARPQPWWAGPGTLPAEDGGSFLR